MGEIGEQEEGSFVDWKEVKILSTSRLLSIVESLEGDWTRSPISRVTEAVELISVESTCGYSCQIELLSSCCSLKAPRTLISTSNSNPSSILYGTSD